MPRKRKPTSPPPAQSAPVPADPPARSYSPEGQLAVETIRARVGQSGAPIGDAQMVALALVEVAEAIREHTEAELWLRAGTNWRRT